ncbi:N-terminal double-transmembrane domain-containing protein [Gemmobacter aquatilis]|uniref:N-terminal double-transmembrane domain-containing protein n=1 Tax=Gemmobacter aquatilis TaxID=933059 RepID=A0A1H8KFD6_9RHOB|nr:DUF4159 domain-containing protein [Gemmobacter aquatilis]SEN91555.1 N-terminal double-transmembrane domain-containing protein [Gemmobacter aquatilis]
MFMLGPLGFTAPLVLLGLIALPVLWLLLRAVPPAPIRRRFPGVALLLGLRDEEAEADKTPLWLLLLRAAAIGAAILAFAGPVLNPQPVEPASDLPLLVLMDGTWADAADWPRRVERAQVLVEAAGRAGRTVALARLSDRPELPLFQSADAVAARLAGMQPHPFGPVDLAGWAALLQQAGAVETVWYSDGLDWPGRAVLQATLLDAGRLRVFEAPRPLLALRPVRFQDGAVQIVALRLPAAGEQAVEVSARGLDPSGIDRELARATLTFASGATEAETALELPPELRNRLTRFEISGTRSAGAVTLTDDSLKRRKVALIGGGADAEGLLLLSPTHYLRQALQPVADLLEGGLKDVLQANPDVIVLTDVARMTQAESDGLATWAAKGGLLLRFAGPKLAASDIGRGAADPLLPVRLREGGRSLGGAMSWGDPKALAPFGKDSPFFGLPIPPEVTVKAQVLAEPDPDLAARTIAALADGTPLVTRKPIGQGQVVLFHVTANADWSSLPLSGLFVQMMERLAVSTRPGQPEAGDLAGRIFAPERVLDAYGALQDPGSLPGVAGEDLAQAQPGPALLPGLYADEDRRVALNVIRPDTALSPAVWRAGVRQDWQEALQERALKGVFLAGALLLLLADVLAALRVSGRLSGSLAARLCVALLALGLAPEARAQDDGFAIAATTEVRLAHVLSGDRKLDDLADAGLRGIGARLFERTTIEPAEPMAVDIERDELAFFPFLYWPISADAPLPSVAAYQKLNLYLRSGGMILFDTRDAGMVGGTSLEAKRLQLIASGLDIPPIAPIAPDHVLTRTFYLLQDFPGRHDGPIWVEAPPPDAVQAEGMPFRSLNDGVTPVVIGGNDWAAAWAMDDRGIPLYPVGRGSAGERQREISYRFGINLIMHVLTGNYKSDQVHVPALLERLGQ